jgi:hypothetical protein
MSVARRIEFVIGPFLIIDLAKISAFPTCHQVLLLARPILTPALSPEDQCSEPVASNNGRPRFRSGSLFVAHFHGPF